MARNPADDWPLWLSCFYLLWNHVQFIFSSIYKINRQRLRIFEGTHQAAFLWTEEKTIDKTDYFSLYGIVLEAGAVHLLSREMLEEIRFLLNLGWTPIAR